MVSIFSASFLISLIFPFLYLYSFYDLLISEVVPQDQTYITGPKIGDRITVYGVWVTDTEFSLPVLGGWNEIHPVRYANMNGMGYGSMPFLNPIFDGVYYHQRYIILDTKNPYRIATGSVMDVLTNPADGDYHIHILVDRKYSALPKIDFVIFPYAGSLRSLSFVLPLSMLIIYVVTSVIKPAHTKLGRYFLTKFKVQD